MCVSCEEAAAALYCNQCEVVMCQVCMDTAHTAKWMQHHVRCHVSERAQRPPRSPLREGTCPPFGSCVPGTQQGIYPFLVSRVPSCRRCCHIAVAAMAGVRWDSKWSAAEAFLGWWDRYCQGLPPDGALAMTPPFKDGWALQRPSGNRIVNTSAVPRVKMARHPHTGRQKVAT